MLKLSLARLEALRKLTETHSIWINTSWVAWPQGDTPKWARDQFRVADELVRLAIIGAKIQE